MNRQLCIYIALILMAVLMLFGCGGGSDDNAAEPINNGPAQGETIINGRA